MQHDGGDRSGVGAPLPSIDLPYDCSVTSNGELRDEPNAPEEMALAVEHLRTLLADDAIDPRLRLRALGMAGTYSRILRRLDDARVLLEEALGLAEQLGEPAGVAANRIRLATVFHWAGDLARADALLDETIRFCESTPSARSYLHFALQHAGKCRLDRGEVAGAIGLLERALEIRLAMADASLIESTGRALASARERMTKG